MEEGTEEEDILAKEMESEEDVNETNMIQLYPGFYRLNRNQVIRGLIDSCHKAYSCCWFK
jgi:hypothetical protein